MLLLLRKGLITCAVASLLAGAQQQTQVQRFTPLEHLDNDTVKLQPSGEPLTFLATWISPELAKYEKVRTAKGVYIRDANGQRLTRYPEKMTLRITIGNKTLLDDKKALELDSNMSAEELARNVHFRLKVYDGLEYRLIEPESVKNIGVPKDVPYNERIYLIEFALKNVPIERRLTIEVLDPLDQRVARFGISLL
jgi:hypothetical protein